jgi:Zn-dependent peptidase ImmA (M78 family)
LHQRDGHAFTDELPDAVAHVTRTDSRAWSPGLLPVSPTKRILLHNDAHSIRRQSSNIAHELAHVLLEHPCTLPIDISGCRVVDRNVEEEANWLGGVLLVPDVAAVHIVRSALTTDEACDRYVVSAELLRMRINMSGARKRVARAYQS